MSILAEKPEVALDAAEWYMAGASEREVAREYGVNHRTVRRWVEAFGFPLRGPRWSKARNGEYARRPVKWFSKIDDGYVVWMAYIPINRRRRPAERVVQIREHRLVMEEAIGRPLAAGETVHHRNAVRHDNRLVNLELRAGPHGTGATHCPHCGGNLTPEAI